MEYIQCFKYDCECTWKTVIEMMTEKLRWRERLETTSVIGYSRRRNSRYSIKCENQSLAFAWSVQLIKVCALDMPCGNGQIFNKILPHTANASINQWVVVGRSDWNHNQMSIEWIQAYFMNLCVDWSAMKVIIDVRVWVEFSQIERGNKSKRLESMQPIHSIK